MINDKYYPIIESAITKYAGEFPNPRLVHALRQVAEIAYKTGRQFAVQELITVDIAAATLKISGRRVRALAKSRNVGWQISRGVWLFTPADVDAMRTRIPGRPVNR